MKPDIYQQILDSWPSDVVPKEDIIKFTQGRFTPLMIINAEGKGNGPEGKFIEKRRVCYKKKELVEWMKSK